MAALIVECNLLLSDDIKINYHEKHNTIYPYFLSLIPFICTRFFLREYCGRREIVGKTGAGTAYFQYKHVGKRQ